MAMVPDPLRRRVALLLAAASVLAPVAAWAEAFPNRPLRFIVPFTAGGSQDVIARIVGQRLAERLGQPVVIDNRSGAAGLLATEATARAAPDGHTILMVTAGPISIAPTLQKKLPYDPLRDLAYVIQLVETPMTLIVNNALPAKTLGDFIAYARAHPGKLSYASVGTGSISHLTMERFRQLTGTDMVHVPYKGAVPAFTDMMSNQVQAMFITTASVAPFVSGGKLRALAVAAPRRTAIMAEVPTTGEAGLKDFLVPVWAGVATTAGSPRAAIARLNQELNAVLQSADTRQRLAELGSETVGGTSEAFTALIRADVALWAKVIRTAGVTAD
jgi:tripartite-type tricarboxylate transporter receptor subunit TctC